MHLLLTTVVSILVFTGYDAINPLQALYGFGSYGGNFIKPPPGVQTYVPEPPLQLTCSAAFTSEKDGHPYIVEALAATIKDKGQGQGYGAPGMGPAGGFFGSPYNPAAFMGGYGGFPGAGRPGLQAQVELFSSVGGYVSIIVTERAFTAEGCINDNYGKGLTPGFYGSGSGGYPGGYGGGLGFASPLQIFGGKGGAGYGPGPAGSQSILTKMDVEPGIPKVISLDYLQNFDSLQQIAGRGLIACAKTELNYDGSIQCAAGAILSCCALSYDNQVRSLSMGAGSYH